MFRINTFLLMIPLLGATTALAGLSKIDAIGMIESGNNDAAIGSSGEISRFQIKPYIWREYSDSRSWRDVRVAAAVAQEYLADLEDTFRKRARREPTDFDLYVLWNAGPAYYSKVGFEPERVHPIIRERARRYVNLRQRNASPPPPIQVAAAKVQTAVIPALAPAPTSASAPLPAPAPLGQILSQPLSDIDSNALAPTIPGLAQIIPPSQPIPAGHGSFLTAGLTKNR